MTEGQYSVLDSITDSPKTVTQILNDLYFDGGSWTYDRIHKILRRLEDGSFVRRVGGYPAKWEVTRAGLNRLHVASRSGSILRRN